MIELCGHTKRVFCVAFSPDGKLLASGSADNTLRLWNVKARECVNVFDLHTDRVMCVEFSPSDDNTLASGSDDRAVYIWDVETGQRCRVLRSNREFTQSLAYSHTGNVLAVTHTAQIKFWNAKTGRHLYSLSVHPHWALCVAFSPDDTTLASGSNDDLIRLWSVNTRQCTTILHGHVGWVWSVAFSPREALLASGATDQTVRIWNVQTGTCVRVLTSHTKVVVSVTFSPNGKTLASGSCDATVRLWNVEKGNCVRTLTGASNRAVCAFSPNGKNVASGSNDNAIRIWSLLDNDVLRRTALLLCFGVSAYVLLDIVDLLLAAKERISFDTQGVHLHYEKICFIGALQRKLAFGGCGKGGQ